MEKEIKGKFIFDQKSKRFHRFQIVTNAGIVGSIYIPKNSEIPERLILEHEGEKDKMSGRQSGQIEAVVNALTELGGEVKSQTPLKDAIIEKLNCSEPTARRLIKQACTMKKIVAIPKIGKGNPYGYRLPVKSFESK